MKFRMCWNLADIYANKSRIHFQLDIFASLEIFFVSHWIKCRYICIVQGRTRAFNRLYGCGRRSIVLLFAYNFVLFLCFSCHSCSVLVILWTRSHTYTYRQTHTHTHSYTFPVSTTAFIGLQKWYGEFVSHFVNITLYSILFFFLRCSCSLSSFPFPTVSSL